MCIIQLITKATKNTFAAFCTKYRAFGTDYDMVLQLLGQQGEEEWSQILIE